MRVPVSWLSEFVALPEGSTGRQVAEWLVRVGFEVEGVESVGQVRGNLIVGRVESVEELTGFKKPIRFCQVAVGAEYGHPDTPGHRGIVCGARNFAAGDLVVVALPGTTLPGDFTIATRETYGRISDGMICSQRELGLGDEHDGIMVLAAGTAAPGADAFPILGLGDEVLDVSVTPDRGYALSIRGIARELAVSLNVPFHDPGDSLPELDVAVGDPVGTASDDPDGCDLIMLRTVDRFDPVAPTPDYIAARLAAVGMRSISLAVDVTNYVMIELGQPLHAFDADRVVGTVRVRPARSGEVLETIDHVRRDLHPEDLVIADDKRALSLAGVMGGLSSEISDTTTRIVIEAAHFHSGRVARTSRRHKLSSEASRRFERGVDRMLPPVASARAVELLVRHGGARYLGATAVETAPDPVVVAFDPAQAGAVAGREYADADCLATLTALGCQVDRDLATWQVRVPSWRPDLQAPIDLIEEIIRVDGYHNLPARLPVAPAGTGWSAQQRLRRRIGLFLAGCGLVEVHNYPFLGVAELNAMDLAPDASRRHAMALANPLSDEQPLLRTTLLPGLLAALARNVSRGFTDAALYELAPVVLPAADQPSGGATDPPRPGVACRPTVEQVAQLEALLPAQPWYVAGVAADLMWHDAVGTALSLALELGVSAKPQPAQVAPWHPGRCAQITAAGQVIGTAGELAPRTCAAFGVPPRSVAFELDASALSALAELVPAAPRISTHPVAKEDIALVVPVDTSALAVLERIVLAAGQLLEEARLFDIYQGPQVPAGSKSLAFNLRFRAPDRTLSAGEVAATRQAVVAACQEHFGAVLRG